MDLAGIDQTVCMPIPPYVHFEDLRQAREIDPGVIPFTGADYTNEDDLEANLNNDVKNGAVGLKLHPTGLTAGEKPRLKLSKKSVGEINPSKTPCFMKTPANCCHCNGHSN